MGPTDIQNGAAPESGATGYVALVGRPNTGKSTLLNTLLECHLAAVSSKPQTTRKYLLGIYNDADSQIMFLDSPGMHAGAIAIDEAMARSVARVLEDADVVACLVDPTRSPGDEDAMVARAAAGCGKPVLLVFNKMDAAGAGQLQASRDFYRGFLPGAPELRISALPGGNAGDLIAALKGMLPQGVFLYDREELTNVYERDIAAELIREVLLAELQQEIPHCIAVVVDGWRVQPDGRIEVDATLNLEREAHKGIVIGRGGRMIKHLRRLATARIAEFCHRRVALALFLKIIPNWRKKKQFLKEIRLLE